VTDELVKLDVEVVEGVVHVALAGEVDLSNAVSVQDQLEQALGVQPAAVIDLRYVTYLDSRGIRVLVQVARDFRGRGGRLTVVAPRETVAGGVLRLARVDELGLDGDAPGADPA